MGEAVKEGVKVMCVGLMIGKGSLLLPDRYGIRVKCVVSPSFDIYARPCLSLEGTRVVADHFPCIHQSKCNVLSGTQWPELM